MSTIDIIAGGYKMSWYDAIEREIDSFYTENTGGLFSKKSITKLIVYPTRFEVTAFPVYDGVIQKESKSFYFEYPEVKEIYEGEIDGKSGIVIEYITNSVVAGGGIEKIIILGITEKTKWIDLLRTTKENLAEKNRKAEEEKRAKELQAKLEFEKRENDALSFYTSCHDFHISEDTPSYDLLRERYKLATIYIGKDRSLNFLKIDGYGQEESNGTIPFEKIHYYEKAGNIHYVADVHGSYSSYGGSVTGGNFSKLATVGGGLLFGMMGMTAGALLTYKPAQLKGGTIRFELESDAKKIDERSVILNFYSDTKKQYIDIELPADIYNFLQTYLPEKKHNIVLELEKKVAVQQAAKQIESGEVLRVASDNIQGGSVDNQMDVFKLKVEKLKMMRDADLLTEEEFKAEKAKLLGML